MIYILINTVNVKIFTRPIIEVYSNCQNNVALKSANLYYKRCLVIEINKKFAQFLVGNEKFNQGIGSLEKMSKRYKNTQYCIRFYPEVQQITNDNREYRVQPYTFDGLFDFEMRSDCLVK